MADPARFDGALMQVAQNSGSIDEICDVFFGFLLRKTDFYTAHADASKAKDIIVRAFERQLPAAEARRVQARQENEAKDAERKARDEGRARKAREEWDRAQQKVVEVDDDAAVGVVQKADTKAEDGTGKPAPNTGNGGTGKGYTWTQTLSMVDVLFAVAPGTKARQCKVEFKKDKLSVTLDGRSLASGPLHDGVQPDECTWVIEDDQLHVTMEKANQMSWWPNVLEGDPEIDTQKITPEDSKLSDLDGETRQTVEKMMYDQRQKQLGKPTSEEQKQSELLDRFKLAHPEMDFSNCKVNYGGGGSGGFAGM